MAIIETEIWKPNPDRPGTVIFDSQRSAQDVFNDLETHLKADGRLPDEYFLFDAFGNWKNGALFPKDAEILCNLEYGGSEGIYLNISVKYDKDKYEYDANAGTGEWKKRTVFEHFATGKTLGESIDDFDKMSLVYSSVMAAFYGSKREVQERYGKIERGEVQRQYPREEPAAPSKTHDAGEPQGSVNTAYKEPAKADYSLEEQTSLELAARLEPSAKVINGEVSYGDWVIVRPDNEHYGCLVGQVTGIEKHSSDVHNADNPGVYVNFAALEYSNTAKAELLEALDGIYPGAADFNDIPLNEVVMTPESLINLTGLDFDHIGELSASYKAAQDFGNKIWSESFYGFKQQLIDRVEKNYADYNQSLLSLSKQDLIEKAPEIHAYSEAWSYMTAYYSYSDEELQFYLQFQSPLEIVADERREQGISQGDMVYTMESVFERSETHLRVHPLINNPQLDPQTVTADDTKSGKSFMAFEEREPQGKQSRETDGQALDSDAAAPFASIDPEARQPSEQENPALLKEKSAFQKALTRGKEKSEAYKAQKAQEPAADRKLREERS